MSRTPTSFGTALSSGIQDISGILSLVGTEQCEFHVGSALRGGGRGGYLYAAITPLSIFGSLGTGKAAFNIMLTSIPHFGAQALQHMGFEGKGDIVAMTMLDGKRYKAETHFLNLLETHHVRSSQRVHVGWPGSANDSKGTADKSKGITDEPQGITDKSIGFPLHRWNFWLLVISLVVASFGVTPYIHFSIQHDTSSPILAILFPLCRVVGGLLCVFPGQLILQYRIKKILEQRALFRAIDALAKQRESVIIPTKSITSWDESCTSEMCLSSLYHYLTTARDIETEFIRCVAEGLGCPLKEVERTLKPYITDTLALWGMRFLLLCGFSLTLAGYVGCFTIVQNSSRLRNPYIWLGAEVTLALIRLAIWATNPSWDDPDGLWLRLDCQKTGADSLFLSTLGTSEGSPHTFKIIPEETFWEVLTAYSGPVDFNGMEQIDKFQHWQYSWIPRETVQGTVAQLCLVLKSDGKPPVMCMMNSRDQLEFFDAEINLDLTHAMKKELCQPPKASKEKMIDHYDFIMRAKNSFSVPIKTSWSLSESSVDAPKAQPNEPLAGDLEQGPLGDESTRARLTWNKLLDAVAHILKGMELTYHEFSDYRQLISDNSASEEKICQDIRDRTQQNIVVLYNARWATYSEAILSLNRLFRPLNSDLVEGGHTKGAKDNIETVENMGFTQWKENVLLPLDSQLCSMDMAGEVNRVLGYFTSRDLTPDKLKMMDLDPKTSYRFPITLSQFCQVYGLSDDIRILLEKQHEFGTADALLEAPDIALQHALLNHEQIAELKGAMQRHLSRKEGRRSNAGLLNFSLAHFCEQYGISGTIYKLLKEEGFETALGLLQVCPADLHNAGFEDGHIAELTGALAQSISRNNVSIETRQGRLLRGTANILPLSLSQFCQEYGLGGHIHTLLEGRGFETVQGLLMASGVALQEAGLHPRQLEQLNEGLRQYLSRNNVPIEACQGRLLGGNADILPLSLSQFCQEYGLSDHIHTLLEEQGFEAVPGLSEVSRVDIQDTGFKNGHIAELMGALAQYLSKNNAFIQEVLQERPDLLPSLLFLESYSVPVDHTYQLLEHSEPEALLQKQQLEKLKKGVMQYLSRKNLPIETRQGWLVSVRDGCFVDIPTLRLSQFFATYGLSAHSHTLLKEQGFETVRGLLLASEVAFQEAGLQKQDLEELQVALRQWKDEKKPALGKEGLVWSS